MIDPSEEKNYIPPDYSDELIMGSVGKKLDDVEIEDSITTEDEGANETILDNNIGTENTTTEKTNNLNNNFNNMGNFGESSPSWGNSSPSWGNNSPSWGQSTGVPFWQTQKQTPGWGGFSGIGGTPSSWGNTGTTQRLEINRNKKIIFCDFLDVLVATWDQNGRPGLPPRDIYDLRPRFEVWDKIAAFNPERVFAVVQKNLINTTNGPIGWELTLSYYCHSLSSYLKIPYTNCQIFAQNIIGQPREEILNLLINNPNNPIKKEDVVYIGLYSGNNGQSDRDIHAARVTEIDYVDLGQLLTNMF